MKQTILKEKSNKLKLFKDKWTTLSIKKIVEGRRVHSDEERKKIPKDENVMSQKETET